jgi:WD40 repeat protein
MQLWDVFTGQELARLEGHRGWVTYLAFAPDGKTLASGSADNTVLIWDTRAFANQGLEPLLSEPEALAK